jgi:hypothetical protein
MHVVDTLTYFEKKEIIIRDTSYLKNTKKIGEGNEST